MIEYGTRVTMASQRRLRRRIARREMRNKIAIIGEPIMVIPVN